MDKLAEQLQRRFEFYSKNPNKPDNQFLELSSFTNYVPTYYPKPNNDKAEMIANTITFCLSKPKMMQALTDSSLSEEEQQQVLLQEFSNNNPEDTKKMITELIRAGIIKL